MMKEPEEPLNAKHMLFSLCIISCLIVGMMAVLFALMAGARAEYLSAAVSLIPAAISFGAVMIACLILIRD